MPIELAKGLSLAANAIEFRPHIVIDIRTQLREMKLSLRIRQIRSNRQSPLVLKLNRRMSNRFSVLIDYYTAQTAV